MTLYVEMFFPYGLIPESRKEKVESINPNEIKVPDDCYAFRFVERTEKEFNGELLTSYFKQVTGMYYPDGEVLTLDEIKRLYKEEPTTWLRNVISNMETNNIKKVVKGRFNIFVKFNEGLDHII